MDLIVRRLVRKLVKNPVVYSGDNPFEDLVARGLVMSDKKGLISMYIAPDGYLECVFENVKPWPLYEALNKICFNTVLVDKNKFRGGKYDDVKKRFVQKFV